MKAKTGLSGPWRFAMWSAAAGLLALPAIAMQFTPEVNWGPGDFIVMGGMLAMLCGGVELAARFLPGKRAFGLAGLALLAIFLLVWAELAVGIF
ncbi:MAG: hypothetical protein H6918_06825 [Sphingomonadaceae bacterium]|nr:hypothetical protein [Sphingomonadaceae bacterium]